MSGCIRQHLGPTKKERIEQTQTFLQQQITLDESEGKANELLLNLERNLRSYKDLLEQLQEASKDNEAKTQRLVAEMEEFSILTLDGDDAICDLKIFLANIAKRKQETTEREERQRERAHQRELQTEKLQLERELHLAKLNQEKELQMEKMKLELEMLKQNEIDKQREHEQKILEVELEAKRKMAQTEKEMELKRTTGDIELKKKAEMEQKRLELGKQFASIHRNPNLQPVDKFNYLRAELEGDANAVISGLELTNSNYEVAVNLLEERFGRDELMMDAHYSALMDLPVSLNVTEKLRATYDMIEKHLRSLKALGENVDQPHFVFLIKSKLPKMVISQMEEYKDMEEKWTVESIRKALKRYICAQEVGERQTQVIQSP
ncbi:calponin homology domain-containing protein DDB_G0272472-like [Acropora muricata]|uniref:calponin homology domain-containing protein DDB_G0272472-like n=1 Tax=Acropora muricata TaxID=159855 RepID=UPI0034E6038B